MITNGSFVENCEGGDVFDIIAGLFNFSQVLHGEI